MRPSYTEHRKSLSWTRLVNLPRGQQIEDFYGYRGLPRCDTADRLIEIPIRQTWPAEQLGKSHNMVDAYVQNRQQPRIEVLYEIAKILGVSVKELLIDNEIKKGK